MKNDHLDVARMRAGLLEAIVPHVPFDGWSEPAFALAVAGVNLDPDLARVICPRGAVDLAAEYHRQGDRAMLAALAEADLSGIKFRDRIATAIRLRLEASDPELVRRGASLFALPRNQATGARLVWDTCDAVWNALGDSSRDYNWYTKRATLAGVYSATVLYWIGDESEGRADTLAFLDRRIQGVMQIEKIKGKVLALPFVKGALGRINAPDPRRDMPGSEKSNC